MDDTAIIKGLESRVIEILTTESWQPRPCGEGFERRSSGLVDLAPGMDGFLQETRTRLPSNFTSAYDFREEHFGDEEVELWQLEIEDRTVYALCRLTHEPSQTGLDSEDLRNAKLSAEPYPGGRICGWSEFFGSDGNFLAGIEWHDGAPAIVEADLDRWRNDKLDWLKDRREVDRGREACYPWNYDRLALKDFADSRRKERGE